MEHKIEERQTREIRVKRTKGKMCINLVNQFLIIILISIDVI